MWFSAVNTTISRWKAKSVFRGETMDVLSATEEDWTNVGMEMLFGVMGLGSQMGVSMY